MPYFRSSSIGLSPTPEDLSVELTCSALSTFDLDEEGLAVSSSEDVHGAMRCCASAAEPSVFPKGLKNPVLSTAAACICSRHHGCEMCETND